MSNLAYEILMLFGVFVGLLAAVTTVGLIII